MPGQQHPPQPLNYVSILDPHVVGSRLNRSDATETYLRHPFQLISFMQQKGGVGKTTVSSSVAYTLAREGKRTLYVDTDSQRNGEQTMLARHVNEHYAGDWKAFYTQAGCETLLEALCAGTSGDARLRAPKLLGIDTAVLEGSPSSNDALPKLLLMLGDDNITEWDVAISQAVALMSLPMGAMYANVPGLFYHLLRLTAYVYNIEYVIVDMSPSGSMFNRAIFMSSDGFFMPSAVDPKCREAFDKFGSSRLMMWWNSFRIIRDQSLNLAGRPTRYVLPDMRPKFLGAVFTRVGYPGVIKPNAQFWELGQICSSISNKLMPTLAQLNLALPPEQYEAIRAAIAAANQMPAGAPAAVHGVAAYIIDYHRLQHMALEASVPVPYLQPHLMWSFNKAAFEEYMALLQGNLAAPPPAPHLLHKKLPAGELQDQMVKAGKIRWQFEHLAQIIIALPREAH